MSLCRSCGAKIDWIETSNGKKMPLDPDYVEYEDANEGDVIVTDGGNTYKVDHTNTYPNVRGRVSHFASCPQGNDWRKR